MPKYKKGSALIISILLLAVISTASFAIARLALIELKSGDLAVGNVKAYYLAEGGIEEGLLRWRYHHQADLPDLSRSSNKFFEKTEIIGSSMSRQTATTANFNSGLNNGSDYIGLTAYNMVKTALGTEVASGVLVDNNHFNDTNTTNSFITNYLAAGARPDLYVRKDNRISFMVTPLGHAQDLKLVWRFHQLSARIPATNQTSAEAKLDWLHLGSAGQFGVEVRLYTVNSVGTAGSLLKRAVFSPADSAHQIEGSNFYGTVSPCASGPACEINVKTLLGSYAIAESTMITITPINANIVVGAYGWNADGSSQLEFGDSITHFESVGTSGGRSRGLETSIDRSSGQILGLFDYVLFQGN